MVSFGEPISALLAVPGAQHGRKCCPNWFCSQPDSPSLAGRCRGFSSPFPVTAAEELVLSGKVAVKPEPSPGSLWVKAALWFCGKLLSSGCPCSLGAAWSCQAKTSSPCRCWETITSPSQSWSVWGRLQSCLACAFCGKTLSCPSPVPCLAALLVLQTCSAKGREGWVQPRGSISCQVGWGNPL